MKYIVIVLLTSIPYLLAAQVSIQQDAAGESSFAVGTNGAVMVNSSDASIGFNIGFMKVPAGEKQRFILVSAKFGATEGTASLFDGSDFKPKAEISVLRGKYLEANSKSQSRFWYYGAAIRTEYFKLWKDTSTVKLHDENFFGFKGVLGYNVLGATRLFKHNDDFGISVTVGRFSNIADLEEVSLYKTKTGSGSAILYDEKSALTGNLEDAIMFKLNLDYMVYFVKNVAVGTYYRGSLGGPFGRQNAGVGLYFGEADAPSKIVAGLFYQVNDIFNQLDEEDNFTKRTSFTLTAGFTF